MQLTLMRGRCSSLISADEADAPHENTSLYSTEPAEIRRVDIIVHDARIIVAGDVIETCAHSPLSVQEMNPPLHVQVQAEVLGKTH